MQDIKKEFINYLETICAENIENQKIPDKIKKIKLKDLNGFISFVNDIKFINHIPNEIEEYLSEYRTFFDRISLHYDENELSKYNIDEKCQILACEIINNLMGYFKMGSKIGDNHSQILHNRALTTMYHYGIITHRLWYSISLMPKQHIKIKEEYDDFNYKVFKPNKNAYDYLYNKMFDDKYKNILANIDKFETCDVIEYNYQVIAWEPKEYGFRLAEEYYKKAIFYKPENKFINQRSKDKLKQHNQTKEMITALSF